MGKQPNNKIMIIGGAAVVVILGGVVWALMGSNEPAQSSARPSVPRVAAGEDLSDSSVGSVTRSAPQQARGTGRLGTSADQDTVQDQTGSQVMPKAKTKKAPKKRY